MDNNKSLQVRKESIFSKIVTFIKKIFKLDNAEVSFEHNSIKNLDNKVDFKSELKIDKVEDMDLINLQQKLEKGEISVYDITDEQVDSVNQLYKRQIEDLKRKEENLKTEINILKYQMGTF